MKVVYTYRPYFNNREKQLCYLLKVDNDLDKEIISIYQDMMLLPPRKYRKDKAKYDKYVDAINKHNEDIDFVEKIVSIWSLDELLDNPREYWEKYSSDLLKALEIIKRFKGLNQRYISFSYDVEKVKLNIERICLENDLITEYYELLDFSRYGYITLQKEREIIEKTEQILDKLGNIENLYYEFTKCDDIKKKVKEHNDEYLELLKNNPLFDHINGHSLDDEQRKAVLNEENSVLVVAGAGSGKTLTICGKVTYLLKEQGVHPKDLLLLSYSKKSTDDLQSKVSKIDARLKVGTFHKIGLEILKDVRNQTFLVEDQYTGIIEKYFREEMKNRTCMLEKILTYYGLYLVNSRFITQYSSEGELYENLKKEDFSTLKDSLVSITSNGTKKETFKKELVKSFEELAIANWYFINGVDYEYERPYEYDVSTIDRRQYTPDFFLSDKGIYHEHYGVNRDGVAAQYEGEEAVKYVQDMKWKRTIHARNRTDCIETYSYEFEDGTVFKKIENELKNRGIELHPLSSEEIFNALHSVYESRSFQSFIILIRSFLSLYKSTYRDDQTFDKLKESEFRNIYEKQRAVLFLDIVKDIYHYYMEHLSTEGKIDFDDMILLSTDELDHTDGYSYKYIIVDEFQDISVSRMQFLKRLIKQGDSRLFAVGDDWQAIYRFSGCDLNIFLDFASYFGDTAVCKITTTHRNSQELQDIAGPFIRKNPEQINKIINSIRRLDNPIQIIYHQDKEDKYGAFLNVLKRINEDDRAANILILGRNNKDIDSILYEDEIYIDYRKSNENKTIVRVKRYPKMNLYYSTVHGSKGLEEDYVILINADDCRTGFPNKMEDDELLNLVLSHKSEYQYAEERRLWYVALTRTRTYTYIIANIGEPSTFLYEIYDQCLVLNEREYKENESINACPRCQTGKLIFRQASDGSNFFGCSNYPYCKYTINDMYAVKRNLRCPQCGDYLIFRKGRWGAFYGCHNYPRCKYTEEFDPTEIH